MAESLPGSYVRGEGMQGGIHTNLRGMRGFLVAAAVAALERKKYEAEEFVVNVQAALIAVRTGHCVMPFVWMVVPVRLASVAETV